MTTLLLIIMLISWAIMALCVLLMNPKWWLGFGVWWVTSGNEYGTSKTVESRLKSIITVTGIIFIISAIFYPYTKPVNQTKINELLNGWTVVSSWDENTVIDSLNLDNAITPTIDAEPTIDTTSQQEIDLNALDLQPEIVVEQ